MLYTLHTLIVKIRRGTLRFSDARVMELQFMKDFISKHLISGGGSGAFLFALYVFALYVHQGLPSISALLLIPYERAAAHS